MSRYEKKHLMLPAPNQEPDDLLILVDANDRPWGKLEKGLVHELGIMHRAFSIFLFNSAGEFLLQQRADDKYHSPGLWTNACCSHPRFGETLHDAMRRRLPEEMGISCDLEFAFSFTYCVSFKNGLKENEYDHVYLGVTDRLPAPAASEVKAWKYMSAGDLRNDLRLNPGNYTYWFRLVFERAASLIQKRTAA